MKLPLISISSHGLPRDPCTRRTLLCILRNTEPAGVRYAHETNFKTFAVLHGGLLFGPMTAMYVRSTTVPIAGAGGRGPGARRAARGRRAAAARGRRRGP